MASKGPLPASLVASAAAALDSDFKTAKKFCVSWFKLALDEALLIWKARNLAKHGGELPDQTPWHEMVRQYHSALIDLRKQGLDIPDKPQIRKANRTTMKRYVDQASELRLSRSIISHVQVNGNNLNADEQRQLHQRLNSRTARVVASSAINRAVQSRQTQLNFK